MISDIYIHWPKGKPCRINDALRPTGLCHRLKTKCLLLMDQTTATYTGKGDQFVPRRLHVATAHFNTIIPKWIGFRPTRPIADFAYHLLLNTIISGGSRGSAKTTLHPSDFTILLAITNLSDLLHLSLRPPKL